MFEFSPFMVKVDNERIPFTHFVIRIFAILGGMISVLFCSRFNESLMLKTRCLCILSLDCWIRRFGHFPFFLPAQQTVYFSFQKDQRNSSIDMMKTLVSSTRKLLPHPTSQ